MRIVISIFIIHFWFAIFSVTAQDFDIPDTVCAEALFKTTDKSVSLNSYFWHFCSANMSHAPTVTHLGNTGFLYQPAYIALAKDNGNYYTFITNLGGGPSGIRSIIKNKYSGDLTSTPTPKDLGNINGVLPKYLEGIQIVQDASKKWYGFAVGGKAKGSRLIRLSFESSLDSFPTATNLGNFNMSQPMDLTLINDGGIWIGFTTNFSGNSITRFVFKKGLNQIPDTTTLLMGKITNPWGLSQPIKENGKWYMFLSCNDDLHYLFRLEFNNLQNLPTVYDISANSGQFPSPRDIVIKQDCEKTYGLIANNYNYTIIRVEFPNGLGGPITPIGSIGGFMNPHGMTEITRDKNDIFVFVTNNHVKNISLSRLQFSTCTEPSYITATQANPPDNFYRNPGTYNINLIDTATEKCKCKNITVIDKPKFSIGNDTTICPYDKLSIGIKNDIPGFSDYLWKDGTIGKTTTTNTDSSIYWMEIYNNICRSRDSIIINRTKDDLFIGNDASFTLGQSIILNASNRYSDYTWSTGEKTDSIEVKKPGIYWVSVQDSVPNTNNTKFCSFTDTIILNIEADIPNFFTPNSDGYNDTWSPRLFYHYPEAEIYIFDRFGKQVAHYRADGPGWDGIYNNKLVTPDTYWYVIDLKDGSKPFRGSLTVITK